MGGKSIIVTDINFVETKNNPKFTCNYKVNSKKIGGSGTELAHTVSVVNTGQGLMSKWKIDEKKYMAQGMNILNTDPPMSVKLSNADDSQRLTGSFVQLASGLSKFRLIAGYVVHGKRYEKIIGEFDVCN